MARPYTPPAPKAAICATCGGDYLRLGPHGLYCGARCARVVQGQRRPDHICPGCQRTFNSHDRNAIYCSQTCREVGQRKVCTSCGADFHPGTARKHDVCRPCRDRPRLAAEAARLAAMAQRRAAREKIRLAQLAPRACRGCGVVFAPQRSSQVFHDGDCRERSYRRHVDVMERRRRAKLVSRRFRTLIYERDKSICYLCRQPIDRTVLFPDAKSPSIDHVMPYSAGGSDDPLNLRAAHLGCNMDKGDRLPYWWERQPVWGIAQAPDS